MGLKQSNEDVGVDVGDEKRPEKDSEVVEHHLAFSGDQVDTGAQLVAGGVDLDPAEALRIRKKIDWHILPLMCGEYPFVRF